MNVATLRSEIEKAVADARQMFDAMDDTVEFHGIVSAIETIVDVNDDELSELISAMLSPAAIALERSLRARQTSLEAKVDASGSVTFVTSHTGMILAASQLAVQQLAVAPGDSVNNIGIPTHSFAALVKKTQALESGYAIFTAEGPGSNRGSVFAAASLPDHKAMFVTALDWTWPDGLGESLKQSFSLTERELQVLAHLMTGHGADEIAGQSGRSVGTVRQQVKSILSKLNVSSQMRAVALVAAAASAWQRLQKVAPQTPKAETQYPLFQDVLRFGARAIGIHRFGQEGGTPVIAVHGALFVPGIIESERRAAAEMGLDVMCIKRPGYGQTSAAASIDTAALTAARDILSVIDHLKLRRVIVVAHDIGCLTAFQLAALAPDRIAAIVAGPTTPPMLSWNQTKDMPRKHRLHAWAAQNAPRLMHLLVTVGLAHVDKVGTASIPDIIFGGCVFDRETWGRDEFAETLPETYRHISTLNGKAFWHDMLLTNHNWTEMAVNLQLPVELLHGELSQTVSQSHVKAFAAKLAHGKFLPINNAGHTMPLTHFDLIFQRAKLMARYI